MDKPIFRVHVLQNEVEGCQEHRHGDGPRPPAAEPHTCPFKEEIGDDYETLCTCCDDCRHECAMDI